MTETLIRKYSIRELKRHLPSAVDVSVAGVLFFVMLLHWLFENKQQTKMKLKVSGEWTEKNNSVNAHCKYTIRGFERHLPSSVSVSVSDDLFFVLLLRWFFENTRWKKMKLKVSWEWTEQNNLGNAYRKYAIRGFRQNLPSTVDVSVAGVLFFVLLMYLLF